MGNILANLGLYSIFKSNFVLWVSLYGTYCLIAIVPLLPFAGGIKRNSRELAGQVGTYLFFFLIVVFIMVGPMIVQTYFLSLTSALLVSVMVVHVFLGVVLFHVVPWWVGGAIERALKVKHTRVAIAFALFILVAVPVYYYAVWNIIPLLAS